MYKLKLPLLIAFFMAFYDSAQCQDTLFYSQHWEKCTKANATYFRLITKSDLYYAKDYYYASGVLQMEGSYSDRKCKIKNGLFIFYNRDASLNHSLNYKNNLREGGFYFPDFGSAVIGNFHQDLKSGEWTEIDSINNLKIVTFYENDSLHGTCFTYYENGNIKRKEIYNKGNLTSGYCYTLTGMDTSYFPHFKIAEYPGGETKMFNFINDNLQYPNSGNNQFFEGRVIVSFKIQEDGAISNVKLDREIPVNFETEILRVINLMPYFSAAKLEGIPIKVNFSLPFRFEIR